MFQRINELQKKKNDAAEAIETAQGQIAELTGQCEQLQKKISELNEAKKAAKNTEQKALEFYASSMNEVAKSALEAAREKLRAIGNAETELNETLQQAEREKASLVEDFSKLERALAVAEIEIWQEIFRNLSLRITETLREDVIKAFIAGTLGKCLGSYENFINGLFPCPGESLRLKAELEKEFCEEVKNEQR